MSKIQLKFAHSHISRNVLDLHGHAGEQKDDEDGDEGNGEEGDEESDEEHARLALVVGFKGVKRIKLASEEVNQEFMKKDLSHYVTPETAKFLAHFVLSPDFISTEPETWT